MRGTVHPAPGYVRRAAVETDQSDGFKVWQMREPRIRDLADKPMTRMEGRFRELLARWRRETRHLSSVNAICTHEAYQQIIGLGTPALPLILNELERRPGQWFWALRAITGVAPKGVKAGDVRAMARYWTNWGRANGYLR